MRPTASHARALALNLPAPDADAAARSNELSRRLREEIAVSGPVPFARFMDRVLYTPELGYYCTDATKFGVGGDFLTAPEISPLFGRCLARPVADVLRLLNADEVLEVGAGSGIMAAELLQALEVEAWPVRRYTILETSPALRRLQQDTLAKRVPALTERVIWRNKLPERSIRGVVLANEVLDAIPATRFRITRNGVKEWHVGWQAGDFVWTLPAATDPMLSEALAAIQSHLDEPLPRGYDSEVNLRHAPWLQALAQRLSAGLILLVDYGYSRREYYHPHRSDGTLVCYYRHRAHGDPLVLPGLQDISIHVDFTTIAEAAVDAGFDVAAFTTQANFLLATGLTELLAGMSAECGQYRASVRQVKRLILPGEMGELVKVMALTRGIPAPFRGLDGPDLRNRL